MVFRNKSTIELCFVAIALTNLPKVFIYRSNHVVKIFLVQKWWIRRDFKIIFIIISPLFKEIIMFN
jgi:hypothetical protein